MGKNTHFIIIQDKIDELSWEKCKKLYFVLNRLRLDSFIEFFQSFMEQVIFSAILFIPDHKKENLPFHNIKK